MKHGAAAAYIEVKGEPKLMVCRAEHCDAVISDKNFRINVIQSAEIIYFTEYLALIGLDIIVYVILGSFQRQGNAALVDDALVFLFQLQKNRGAFVLGDTVAAEPKLFLVKRLFQRVFYDVIVVIVKIYAANGMKSVLILLHISRDPFSELGILLRIEQVFHFLASEYRLNSHCPSSFCVDAYMIQSDA